MATYTWRHKYGAPAHDAAGRGSMTACGRVITRTWEKGDAIPPDRPYCRRCRAMTTDTKARPG
jgi:hypothetical protein